MIVTSKISSEVIAFCETSLRLIWGQRKVFTNEMAVPIAIQLAPIVDSSLSVAWLVLSLNKKASRPYVRLSNRSILKIPHVDENGKLCLFIDEEELDVFPDTIKIQKILDRFFEVFIPALNSGQLNNHFHQEPINYWNVNVSMRNRKGVPKGGSNTAYLLGERDKRTKIYDSYNIKGFGYICGEDNGYRKRFLQSNKSTREKISIIEVPINFSFSPKSWPLTSDDLRRVCNTMAGTKESQRFFDTGKTTQSKLVVLRAPDCDYGYLISGLGKAQSIYPKYCERADPRWLFGRYQEKKTQTYLSAKIAILGAGSLGSHVIQTLAHSGVGELHIIDPDNLSPANLGRHVLGATSIGLPKCSELADWLTSSLPNCHLKPTAESAESWLSRTNLSQFDLVVDLTGERTVREEVAIKLDNCNIPVITAWMEPYVSAAHVIIFQKQKKWMKDGVDLWDTSHAFSNWPSEYILKEPGCSSRFFPYAISQLAYAAALTAEACLSTLIISRSKFMGNVVTVKSWVRGENYTGAQRHKGERRDWAQLPLGLEGALIERVF